MSTKKTAAKDVEFRSSTQPTIKTYVPLKINVAEY